MSSFIQDRTTGAYFAHPVLITDVSRDEIFKRMETIEGNVLRVDTYTIEGHDDGKGGTFTLYAAVLLVQAIDVPPPYAESDRRGLALRKLWDDALKSRHFSDFNDHTVNVTRAALAGEDFAQYTV